MFFISLHITRLSAKTTSTLNAQDISLLKMVRIIEYYLPGEIRVAICLIYPSWLGNILNGTYLGRWTAYLAIAYVSRKDKTLDFFFFPPELIVLGNSPVCSFAYTKCFMKPFTPTDQEGNVQSTQAAALWHPWAPLTPSPADLHGQSSKSHTRTCHGLEKGCGRKSCSQLRSGSLARGLAWNFSP